MFMWKVLLWVTIFYIVISIISKIFDKRKVKKYGKNIVIGRADDRNNDTDDNGNADAGTDKQQSSDNR